METNSFKIFLTVWVGQLLSGLGSGMTAFAIGVLTFKQTESVFMFSMVIAAYFGPSIIIKPVGGVLADRIDRRFLIAGGDIGSGLCILFLLISNYYGNMDLLKIFICISLSSIFNAIQYPAYKSAATDLLSKEQYSRAAGLMQLASSAQHLISPFAAGILLTLFDISIILIIDISTFLSAILAIIVIGKPLVCDQEEKYKNLFRELESAWQIIRSTSGIIPIIAILTFLTFCIGFIQTLLGPMILSFADSAALGAIQSISAFGMLFSSFFITFTQKNLKQTTIFCGSLTVSGIFLSLMGLRPDKILITVSGFIFFCTLPFINTSADVLIRKRFPNNSQGKVWSLIGVLTQTGYLTAYFLSGIIAENIFTPLLIKDGFLASTIGIITGTGSGRGIGLFIIVIGLSVSMSGVLSIKINSIKNMEINNVSI